MKRPFLIPILLLAFIVLSSKQCAEDADPLVEVDTQLEEISAVKSAFESDYLKSESLFAFEEKAKQKLSDYSDYLNIAKDTSLDTTFRHQAANMIPHLFYQKKEPIISTGSGSLALIDSIYMIKPLSKTSTAIYTGSLGFHGMMTDIETNDSMILSPQKWTIEMIATKTLTSFGKDTLRVWKVFLGEMISISN